MYNKREDLIAVTSVINIIINLIVSVVKIVVGLLASSIAILSEGVNNASDVLSSILTLVGSKLAQKHPDENHPFGYGRIEYLTSLIVSVLILITGFEMLISSAELIFIPRELNISYYSLIIVSSSAVIKWFLGNYTVKMGRKSGLNSLVGVGLESRHDSLASVFTVSASLIYLLFSVSLDAYVGILISVLIIKSGYDILKTTVSDLLGRPGEHKLAMDLYKEIRKTDGIIAAADMRLHNYGPNAWSGSVNLEIDCNKTVGEIYQFIHELQLRIMHEYNVTMVFGIYAVDNSHEDIKALRSAVASFIKSHEHIKSFHALYLDV